MKALSEEWSPLWVTIMHTLNVFQLRRTRHRVLQDALGQRQDSVFDIVLIGEQVRDGKRTSVPMIVSLTVAPSGLSCRMRLHQRMPQEMNDLLWTSGTLTTFNEARSETFRMMEYLDVEDWVLR